MKKQLLFFAIFFVFAGLGRSIAQDMPQQSCADKWDEARTSFENGHLYNIPSLLGDCLQNGFSKQEKIDAYRLLTITYLYIDDPIGAQNSFLNLLKLDPEYRIQPSDPIELAYLSKEYITTPIISWRVRGGVNYSFINVINKRSTGNDNLSTEKYTPSFGFEIVGSLDIHFNKIISLGIDADVSIANYKYENHLFNNSLGEQNAKDVHGFNESAYNVSIPVYLKLTYPGVKYYPYIYGGYSPVYNIYTSSTTSYTNFKSDGSYVTIDPKVLNISPLRQKFSNSIVVGAGLMRRIHYKYVFVDVRYRFGLDNLLNKDNSDKYEEYPDINIYSLLNLKNDSDFRKNDLSVTVGYVWPQYKPRKKRLITFKSMLSSMFKKRGKDE